LRLMFSARILLIMGAEKKNFTLSFYRVILTFVAFFFSLIFFFEK